MFCYFTILEGVDKYNSLLYSLFLTIKSFSYINAVWIYNKLLDSLLKTVSEFIKNVFLTYSGRENELYKQKRSEIVVDSRPLSI